MDDITKSIQSFYDSQTEMEWGRIENRPEFLLTCRFLNRYLKPGSRVLDIGGGPGRYSLHLAAKGCDVTLFDLSEENTRFASARAREQNLPLQTVCGDARNADSLVKGSFDHVLLMGPLYHILDESGRIQAVNAALRVLKPGGTLSVSFINMFAGIIFAMKDRPDIVLDPVEQDFYQTFIEGRSFAGKAFTEAYFARQEEVLPFMEQFPLQKLHFFGQESILSPCEQNIMGHSQEIINEWLDLGERLCEREDLLSWSEHLMYIGRKTS